MSDTELALLAEKCAKFAEGLKELCPRGVFTLDTVPEGGCFAVYNTIPYPSELAGFTPGQEGEALRVIGRLKAKGARYLAGAQYPDPDHRADTLSYALLFSIGDQNKKLLTRLALEEMDRGTIEQ